MARAPRGYIVEVAKNQSEDWRSHDRITLGISVGAHYHEGAKFAATMRWVEQHFQSCAILVCDSLHRYNEPQYYAGDLETALATSIKNGTDWLERNSIAITSASIPCAVTRWEDWRLHPDFHATYEQIARVHADDAGLRDSVDESVQRYLRHHPAANEDISGQRAEGSRFYILEELAGLTLFARQNGTWEAYAGSKIAALDYLKSTQRNDLPEPLLDIRSIKIHLKEIRLAA